MVVSKRGKLAVYVFAMFYGKDDDLRGVVDIKKSAVPACNAKGVNTFRSLEEFGVKSWIVVIVCKQNKLGFAKFLNRQRNAFQSFLKFLRPYELHSQACAGDPNFFFASSKA